MGVIDRVYRTEAGDLLRDWQRGLVVVDRVIRAEDVVVEGRFYRGSPLEQCALHGGRPQRFPVRD